MDYVGSLCMYMFMYGVDSAKHHLRHYPAGCNLYLSFSVSFLFPRRGKAYEVGAV